MLHKAFSLLYFILLITTSLFAQDNSGKLLLENLVRTQLISVKPNPFEIKDGKAQFTISCELSARYLGREASKYEYQLDFYFISRSREKFEVGSLVFPLYDYRGANINLKSGKNFVIDQKGLGNGVIHFRASLNRARGQDKTTDAYTHLMLLKDLEGVALQGFVVDSIPIPEEPQQIFHCRNTQNTLALYSDAHEGLILYDIEHRRKKPLSDFQGTIQQATFSPDGKLLLLALGKPEAQLWDLNGRITARFRSDENDILCVAFAPGGEVIATGGQNQQVILWKPNEERLRVWEASSLPILTVSFSPNGEQIISGGVDGIVRIWDRDGTLIRALEEQNAAVTAASILSTGSEKQFMIAGKGYLKVYSEEGTLIHSFSIPNQITACKVGRTADETNYYLTDRYGEGLVLNPQGQELGKISLIRTIFR